jgi:stearoyl-CoA desaturase (delta-9 desaturase)|eukprot:CAMPEP_0174292108 /NCGR_PEP_ID=MMETSP0809-20121228/34313_1 /TAXON_ID=73025 ORGANISM="Eutreptiella gymnastica-like, Strain CCMP1594" /NCGR_SAMPLE_ID=MMETSP0809 /ASSEMBLY_ACC=CAM_ASM_000658 /LENGTH=560 /DNA_ID=CAMNT_0015391947 /DNA_START=26 /DNA_END=1708 /DNA_ORIENTATION=-
MRIEPAMKVNFLLLMGIHLTFAHRDYLNMVPNGPSFENVWPALGHVAPSPSQFQGTQGFPRNPFGRAFQNAGFRWTAALCQEDSDGDGLSNGEELGDPFCTWRFGDPSPPYANLSHPGVPDVGIGGLASYWAARAAATWNGTNTHYSMSDGAVAAPVFYYHYVLVPLLFCLALGLWMCGVSGAFFPNRLLMVLLTYLVCHVGIFVGAHRCYSHHQCKPNAAGHLFFAILGTWALQGPITHWAFYHRLHHRFCEQELDFHSPKPPHDFFWAQGLWFVEPSDHVNIYAHQGDVIPDMIDENAVFPEWASSAHAHAFAHMQMLAGFFAVCLLVNLLRRGGDREGSRGSRKGCRGSLEALVTSFCATVYYFMVPACLAMQITMLVNSAVHLWGDEPFADGMSAPCSSKNNALLFPIMMGENWHNNHHAAPGSATTWVWWYQIDFQYISMRILEVLGLVSDIHLQPPSQVQEGYESLSFFSVLESWVMITIILAAPLVPARLWKLRGLSDTNKSLELEVSASARAFLPSSNGFKKLDDDDDDDEQKDLRMNDDDDDDDSDNAFDI